MHTMQEDFGARCGEMREGTAGDGSSPTCEVGGNQEIDFANTEGFERLRSGPHMVPRAELGQGFFRRPMELVHGWTRMER